MQQPTAERWRLIEELLDAALELPPAARTAFVERSAPSDADLRSEVLRLLSAHEHIGDFLERPAPEFAPLLLPYTGADPARMPERIGPYRVLAEAGEGGMGTVYLAERDDPDLRQRVALKLLRAGLTGGTLVSRFLEERRILASLEHPNIARLLDGGITEDGVPWFAMEYVEGTPIDRFCADRELDVASRLRLFLDVCDAVQYAHRNLVVHRDLKPSNILVTEDGHVKLLDFGIAKLLTAEPGAAAGELTQVGLRLMTPGYASPEQVRGESVSTVSDVYSLGVLLYTLLVGRHPYLAPSLQPHEVARAILEDEPKPPSTLATAAARSRLRGDLDTIVLTAMRKVPERRYATAERLAADIRLYLAGLPVSARADSWSYRAGKFVHRHRGGVAAAAAFAMLLGGYGVTVTVQAEQLGREVAKTKQVRDFLQSLFTHADPAVTLGREPTVSQLVEQGAQRVATELAGQPDVQAEMMTTLGQVYLVLGRFEPAIEQLRPALAIRRRIHLRPHEAVIRTSELLSEALHYHGEFAEAEALLREAIQLRRQLYGDRHAWVGIALNTLGDLLHTRGELAEAEEQLRQALVILLPASGETHPDVARARRDLANVLRDRGAHAEAEPLYRDALAALEQRLGQNDPMATLTRSELARLLAETGGYAEAEQILLQNLGIYRELFPQDHPMLGVTMRNLGVLRLRQGRPEEAADALREALAIFRRTLPEENAFMPRTQRHLAQAELDAGNAQAAATLAETALRHLHRLELGGHRAAADARHTLGLAHLAQDRPAEALEILRVALSERSRYLVADHSLLAETRSWIGDCLSRLGRFEEAEPSLLGGYRLLLDQRGEQDRFTRRALYSIIQHYERSGRPEQAAEYRARL